MQGWIINQTNPTITNRQLIGAVLSTQDQEIVQVLKENIIQSKARFYTGQWTITPKEQRDSSTLRWMWP